MRVNRLAIGKVLVLFLSLIFAAASVDASARPLVLNLGPAATTTSSGKLDNALIYEAEWALYEAPAGDNDPPAPVQPSFPLIIAPLHSAKTQLPPQPRAPPRGAPCPAPPATGPPCA
jgi:hypothetical protein